MTQDTLKDTCDSCGCSAEIGTIIREDDCVHQVTLAPADPAAIEQHLADMRLLAQGINPETEFQVTTEGDNTVVTLTFSCTAEKLIYELKARSFLR